MKTQVKERAALEDSYDAEDGLAVRDESGMLETALSYYRDGNIKKSVSYLKRHMNTLKLQKNQFHNKESYSQTIGKLEHFLGMFYFTLNDTTKALEYFHSALQRSYRFPNRQNQGTILEILVFVAKIYLSLGPGHFAILTNIFEEINTTLTSAKKNFPPFKLFDSSKEDKEYFIQLEYNIPLHLIFLKTVYRYLERDDESEEMLQRVLRRIKDLRGELKNASNKKTRLFDDKYLTENWSLHLLTAIQLYVELSLRSDYMWRAVYFYLLAADISKTLDVEENAFDSLLSAMCHSLVEAESVMQFFCEDLEGKKRKKWEKKVAVKRNFNRLIQQSELDKAWQEIMFQDNFYEQQEKKRVEMKTLLSTPYKDNCVACHPEKAASLYSSPSPVRHSADSVSNTELKECSVCAHHRSRRGPLFSSPLRSSSPVRRDKNSLAQTARREAHIDLLPSHSHSPASRRERLGSPSRGTSLRRIENVKEIHSTPAPPPPPLFATNTDSMPESLIVAEVEELPSDMPLVPLQQNPENAEANATANNETMREEEDFKDKKDITEIVKLLDSSSEEYKRMWKGIVKLQARARGRNLRNRLKATLDTLRSLNRINTNLGCMTQTASSIRLLLRNQLAIYNHNSFHSKKYDEIVRAANDLYNEGKVKEAWLEQVSVREQYELTTGSMKQEDFFFLHLRLDETRLSMETAGLDGREVSNDVSDVCELFQQKYKYIATEDRYFKYQLILALVYAGDFLKRWTPLDSLDYYQYAMELLSSLIGDEDDKSMLMRYNHQRDAVTSKYESLKYDGNLEKIIERNDRKRILLF